MAAAIGSDTAATQFRSMLIEAGVTSTSPDFSKAWQIFQDFCEVPIRCTSQGFMFEAHYKTKFVDGDWQLNKTAFITRLTRYWYKPGKISDTTYLAEARWTFVVDTRIPKSTGNVSIQVETLASYRKETSALPNLIKWVSQAKVNSFTVYAGKR